MTDEQKPLAQMSPAELTKLWWSNTMVKVGDDLHALIQRATQEAREGMVEHRDYAELQRSHTAESARLNLTRIERDEARAQLAEAERKLASAGKERDLLNWILARCHVKTADGRILRTFDEAMDAYPAPTPAASGTPDGVALISTLARRVTKCDD